MHAVLLPRTHDSFPVLGLSKAVTACNITWRGIEAYLMTERLRSDKNLEDYYVC